MKKIVVTLNGKSPSYPINLSGTKVGQFAVVWHQGKSPPIWQIVHLETGANVGSFQYYETAHICAQQLDQEFDLSGVTPDYLQAWTQANSGTLRKMRDLIEEFVDFEAISDVQP